MLPAYHGCQTRQAVQVGMQELEAIAKAAAYSEYVGGKKAPGGPEALHICRPKGIGAQTKRWRVVGLDQSMDAAAAEDCHWEGA